MSKPLNGAAAIFEQLWRSSEKECEELRAVNERLRAALKPFAEQDLNGIISLEDMTLRREHFEEARRAYYENARKK